jgi:hypothetical protein
VQAWLFDTSRSLATILGPFVFRIEQNFRFLAPQTNFELISVQNFKKIFDDCNVSNQKVPITKDYYVVDVCFQSFGTPLHEILYWKYQKIVDPPYLTNASFSQILHLKTGSFWLLHPIKALDRSLCRENTGLQNKPINTSKIQSVGWEHPIEICLYWAALTYDRRCICAKMPGTRRSRISISKESSSTAKIFFSFCRVFFKDFEYAIYMLKVLHFLIKKLKNSIFSHFLILFFKFFWKNKNIWRTSNTRLDLPLNSASKDIKHDTICSLLRTILCYTFALKCLAYVL